MKGVLRRTLECYWHQVLGFSSDCTLGRFCLKYKRKMVKYQVYSKTGLLSFDVASGSMFDEVTVTSSFHWPL